MLRSVASLPAYFCSATDVHKGKTYSGRLPYHLACESIILMPAPTFLMHTTHLLRPAFSALLPLRTSSEQHPTVHPSNPTPPPLDSYPLFNTSLSWPLSYPPEQANIIFIQPDWSDLEDVILYLRDNQHLASGIARRQRKLWVEGGWLGAAAETCYWRALLKGWAERARIEEADWAQGMRWETFSLLGTTVYNSTYF